MPVGHAIISIMAVRSARPSCSFLGVLPDAWSRAQ
jgi:hypothetical protein